MSEAVGEVPERLGPEHGLKDPEPAVGQVALAGADHWLWVGPRGAWRADPELAGWLIELGVPPSGARGVLAALAALAEPASDPLASLSDLGAPGARGPLRSAVRPPGQRARRSWSWQAARTPAGATWLLAHELPGQVRVAGRPGLRLETLLRLLPDVVAVLDPKGRIRTISDAAYDWVGLPRSASPEAFVATVDPEDQARLAAWFRKVLAGEEPGNCEYRSRDRQGGVLVLEASGRPIGGPPGAPIGAVLVIRDLTGPLTVEAELQVALAEARRAAAAQGELLQRFAQELGPPLQRVLVLAEELARGPLPEGHAESVGYVLRAARHLEDLLGELAEVARAERQTMEVRLAPVSLRPVVDDAIQLTRPAAAQAGVVLEEVRWSGPDETWVRADRQRLLQVLLNLLANAVKYNRPGGRIEVQVEVDPSTVRLAVTDTGIGIAPENVPRLFEPFERLGAEHQGVPGTGVGLTLSRHLVELMGGRITVRSTLGVGSTFAFDLVRSRPPSPRRPAPGPSGEPGPTGPRSPAATLPGEQAAVVAKDPFRHTPDLGSRGAGPWPRSLRILHVEDDPVSAELVRQVLRRSPGLELRHAASGSAALSAALAERPDLVLLDLGLPDLPGWEVALRLHWHPETCQVPVVVVSADADHAARVAAACSNVVARLSKPVVVDQLLAAVQAATSGRSAWGSGDA